MSHTVTVTRTTTTTSTSAILLNVGYFKTIPGILKLIHIILGVITVSIIGHYIAYHKQAWGRNPNIYNPDHALFIPELFFLLIATTCLITSTLLLFSCLISIATATIIPKTVFEIVFHLVGCILLLLASILFLYYIETEYKYRNAYYLGYKPRLAAAEVSFMTPLIFLLLVASANFLGNIVWRNSMYDDSGPKEPGYGGKVFAGILGLINSVIYGGAAFLAFRNFRMG